MSPASRYSTSDPATATFRLAPEPTMGISTAMAVLALLAAGCGSNPVPPPVMAHGVAAREPLTDSLCQGSAGELLFFWLSHPRDLAVDAYRVTQSTSFTICNIWLLAEG